MERHSKHVMPRDGRRLAYAEYGNPEGADELNYKTVFYLSRQFRNVTGIPPGAYRRK